MAAIAKFISYDGGAAFSETAMKMQKSGQEAIIVPLEDVVAVRVKRPQEDLEGFIQIETDDGDRHRIYFEDEQLQEAIRFKQEYDRVIPGRDIISPHADKEPAPPQRRKPGQPMQRKRPARSHARVFIAVAVFAVLAVFAVIIISSSSSPSSDNPLLDLKVDFWPVKNGAGTETIGKWASVSSDKNTFENSSSEQFREFVEAKVLNRDYNWFTVFFEDGTGLKLGDSMPVEYGQVDQDGTIIESFEIYYYGDDGTYQQFQ